MSVIIDKPFAEALAKLRAKRPLVHNITNFVVMNFTANVLLAAGASPVMAHAPEEVADFVAISGGLVINMGTVDSNFLGSFDLAIKEARKKDIPWVLDPVGVGATPFRARTGKHLADQEPVVIRGNASEIMALAGRAAASKGVDSLEGSYEAIEAAKRLSAKCNTVVAVTGETDYVVDGDDVIAITGGNALSQQVTGTGCATTALIGAFLAVAPPREAAVAALQLMKFAAAEAGKGASGPGRFAVALIDALASA
jgi:hydroxyethylthiazole kinase